VKSEGKVVMVPCSSLPLTYTDRSAYHYFIATDREQECTSDRSYSTFFREGNWRMGQQCDPDEVYMEELSRTLG